MNILCWGLKICSWVLLVYGMFVSFSIALAFAPVMLMNYWSGVVVLFVFIAAFLFINLAVKTARMIFEIKKKVII